MVSLMGAYNHFIATSNTSRTIILITFPDKH